MQNYYITYVNNVNVIVDIIRQGNVSLPLNGDCPWLGTHLLPRNAGHDLGSVNPVLVMDSEVKQGIEQGVREQVGLQAQLNQLRVLGIVVVLLGLHPWVGDRLGLHVQTELGSCSSH